MIFAVKLSGGLVALMFPKDFRMLDFICRQCLKVLVEAMYVLCVGKNTINSKRITQMWLTKTILSNESNQQLLVDTVTNFCASNAVQLAGKTGTARLNTGDNHQVGLYVTN